MNQNEISYAFPNNGKRFESSISMNQVDSIYNGTRYLRLSDLPFSKSPTDSTLTIAPKVAPVPATVYDYNSPKSNAPSMDFRLQADLANSRGNGDLSLEQRSNIAGYYLEQSANNEIAALITVVSTGILGIIISNSNSGLAGPLIITAGATAGLILEISSISKRRKAGRYLMNKY
jgi:hypothetical protein